MASAINNDVARIGSLIAVAVLPALGGITGSSYLHPQALAHGFEKAVLIAGSWCVVGGIAAAIGIRNPTRRDRRTGRRDPRLGYCALEATPLRRRSSRQNPRSTFPLASQRDRRQPAPAVDKVRGSAAQTAVRGAPLGRASRRASQT